ncbi:hypothetical protein [Cylindrospermum sp. FACHB-282]|uniref:hypothetical protein n=1 Tax=Cylindrospermum sp. FACHB-282 TaxID=2692794 RepID=UPI0016850ED8|nr:hypothetical protein [Cylindrospermum sp. FACHB-282]MBD2388763.1 hypothetical protein [Cylindrospermum sp. FACHB-282]
MRAAQNTKHSSWWSIETTDDSGAIARSGGRVDQENPTTPHLLTFVASAIASLILLLLAHCIVTHFLHERRMKT